jgi:hypothetical protein
MLPRRVIPFAEPGSRILQSASCPQTSIVQIGRDHELLRLRARIIHSAGYSVRSLLPDEVTPQLRKAPGGQLWVFCHTLQFYEVALLAVAVRSSCPSDKLLRLTGFNDAGSAPGFFDELLESTRGVDELLRAISRLARQSTPGNPR